MANAFQHQRRSAAATYANAGDLHGACLAVRDRITANLDGFQAVWEYGYADPTFDAENGLPVLTLRRVC